MLHERPADRESQAVMWDIWAGKRIRVLLRLLGRKRAGWSRRWESRSQLAKIGRESLLLAQTLVIGEWPQKAQLVLESGRQPEPHVPGRSQQTSIRWAQVLEGVIADETGPEHGLAPDRQRGDQRRFTKDRQRVPDRVGSSRGGAAIALSRKAAFLRRP